MMRVALAVPLLVVALSGCLGGGSTDSTPTLAAGALPDDDPAVVLNNTTLPTLGLPFDPWPPNATELALFEGLVESSLSCTILGGNQLWGGCGYFRLPTGTLVPEGTAALRIEADASGATRQGSWDVFLDTTYGHVWNYGNTTLEGEPTRDASHVWRIPLAAEDWDVPALDESRFTFSFWAYGDRVNLLHGPIATKVVAERDPDWVPLAAVDAFAPGSGYDSPRPGVVTLLAKNITMDYSSAVNGLGFTTDPTYPDPVPFERKVPVGTQKVALGIYWGTIDGCASPGQCSVRGGISSGSQGGSIFDADVNEVGDAYRILIYDVDDVILMDSPYTSGSMTQHEPWLDDCTPDGSRDATDEACASGQFGPSNDLHANVRYLAEAWRGPVDLAAFKARLGIK